MWLLVSFVAFDNVVFYCRFFRRFRRRRFFIVFSSISTYSVLVVFDSVVFSSFFRRFRFHHFSSLSTSTEDDDVKATKMMKSKSTTKYAVGSDEKTTSKAAKNDFESYKNKNDVENEEGDDDVKRDRKRRKKTTSKPRCELLKGFQILYFRAVMGYPGSNRPIWGRNWAAPGPSVLIWGKILAAQNISSSSLPRFADWGVVAYFSLINAAFSSKFCTFLSVFV